MPVHLKPLQLAEQGAHVEGGLKLAGMPRLGKSLTRADNNVHVSVVFGHRPDGTASVSGTIQTTLAMQCQRCLGEVSIEIDRAFELQLVPADDAKGVPPEAGEPEVYELPQARIPSRDLIEDELLLSLPPAPRHADLAECDADTAGHLVSEFDEQAESNRHNPFAVLKDLK